MVVKGIAKAALASCSFMAGTSICVAQGVVRIIYNTGSVSIGNPSFGAIIVPMGDVNGDGLDDVLFAAPGASLPGGGSGLVRLAGGAGGWILSVTGISPADYFAQSSGGGMDATGDGVPDFVVGSVQPGPGEARLFSGSTGSWVRTLPGTTAGDLFGRCTELADCNGDGYADVVAGTNWAQQAGGARTGHVQAQSGRDGSLLWSLVGVSAEPLLNLGDVNHDGRDDILCGLAIRSGQDGSLILQCQSPVVGGTILKTARAGDVDGDGTPDFLMSLMDYRSTAALVDQGYAGVISGSTGTVIRQHFGVQASDSLGIGIAGGFDADNDDVPDYAIRAKRTVAWTPFSGRVDIYSGATGMPVQTWQTPSNDRDGGIAVAGDIDGDGTDELVFGSIYNNVGCSGCGAAYYYQVRQGPAGTFRRFGKGCPGADGRLPTALAAGLPRTGRTMELRLRAGPANSAVIVAAGTPLAVDLTSVGAPGCQAHAAPFWWTAIPTDAYGLAEVPIYVPNNPSLSGFSFDSQWIVFDPLANSLGLVTSTAVRANIGM